MFSFVTDKLERRKDSQEGCEAERAVTIERSCPAGFLAHSFKSWWGMDLHSSVLNGVLYAPTHL